MNVVRICPQCSQPLPDDSPEGLCPACLLNAAFATQSPFPTVTGAPLVSSFATRESLDTQTINPTSGMRVKYFGDYEVIEEIARGGMGVVLKARQNTLNRTVAIKMILAGKLAGSTEVQRFRREAEAAANLQHPNIVAIHEVGEFEGQHYFSMDYVEGRDLGSLARAGAMPAQRAARYVKIIAEAIHFAHQRGTLHRDLKPQNVLIDRADQPRITDFGLAKLTADDGGLTQDGVVMGSPSYMPPEQAAGRHDRVGPHSDVYSLGAILYELLTGRPPFRGPNAVATLQAVMGSEAVAPRTLNPDVPPDAETICLKCLEKAPERRYHSARELAEDLDRFLKQEPVLARPAGVVRKTLSWMRSRPQTLIGVAALAIVALGFFTFQLIEENAFLRAQHLDPTLTRQPGSLSGALPIWNTIAGFLGVGGLLANLWIQSRGAGSWRAVFDPVKNLRPPKAVSRPVMFTALGMGLVCVTFGVVFLGKIIQTNVWEGDSPSNYYLGVYAVVWFGLTALWQVARVYQRSTFGAPPRDLTVEQIAEVRRAVNESDLVGAIKLYRRAVPDANFSEANEFVADLAAEVERAEPGKKIAPSLALKDMNWRLAALCAAIEAVLLGAYVSAWPPAHPLGFAIGVSGFYLFGAGIMIGTRLQGFWKRALLVVPAVILAAVGHELTPEIPTLSDLALLPYLGMAAGCAVVVSAFTKPGATRADDARLSDEQP